MKLEHTFSHAVRLVICGLLTLMVWLTAGCTTNRPPTTLAFLTLQDTQNLVDKAMTGYGELCALGLVTAADQARVDQAHAVFQHALATAITAARQNWSAPTDTGLNGLSTELIALINSIPMKL